MADVIQKIFAGDPITNGGAVVKWGRGPNVRPYQSDSKDGNSLETGYPNQNFDIDPDVNALNGKYSTRFNHPPFNNHN